MSRRLLPRLLPPQSSEWRVIAALPPDVRKFLFWPRRGRMFIAPRLTSSLLRSFRSELEEQLILFRAYISLLKELGFNSDDDCYKHLAPAERR